MANNLPSLQMNLLSTSFLLDKLVSRESLHTLVLNLYPGNKGYSLAFRVLTGGAASSSSSSGGGVAGGGADASGIGGAGSSSSGGSSSRRDVSGWRRECGQRV